MRVIVKHPHERIGRMKEIPNTLNALQQTVDGHIETVYLDSGHTNTEVAKRLNRNISSVTHKARKLGYV